MSVTMKQVSIDNTSFKLASFHCYRVCSPCDPDIRLKVMYAQFFLKDLYKSVALYTVYCA